LVPSRLNDDLLARQNFSLGDRVIFALDFGAIPFGSAGTIVGTVFFSFF